MTVSWKITGSAVFGMVNVGLTAVVLDSVAGTPPVCFHTKPLAPVEPEPSRVTVAPARTDCGGPAFARGGATSSTVTTSSVVLGPPGPWAVSRKVNVVATFVMVVSIPLTWLAQKLSE